MLSTVHGRRYVATYHLPAGMYLHVWRKLNGFGALVQQRDRLVFPLVSWIDDHHTVRELLGPKLRHRHRMKPRTSP